MPRCFWCANKLDRASHHTVCCHTMWQGCGQLFFNWVSTQHQHHTKLWDALGSQSHFSASRLTKLDGSKNLSSSIQFTIVTKNLSSLIKFIILAKNLSSPIKFTIVFDSVHGKFLLLAWCFQTSVRLLQEHVYLFSCQHLLMLLSWYWTSMLKYLVCPLHLVTVQLA